MNQQATADQASAALRGVLSAFKLWKLSQFEQVAIFGLKSSAELGLLRTGDLGGAQPDLVERLSLILGIYKALGTLLSANHSADAWMRMPNAANPFAGRSAVQLAASGDIGDLWRIRRYLDAQIG